MMGCCLRIRPETLDLAQHLSGLRPSAPPTGKDSSEGQGDGSVPTLGTPGQTEKAMATHSSTLSWRIPGTGEPGGLPSMGSHRVGHD